ncbi:hypothetical protein BZG11_04415 [Salinivibrio kushneri]|nr:hypothetical protein BZG10_06930 [Salinivibrio kushneri]OOE52640.1 hypothetical protein BZG11_04415 [Salinivibrio kushneri]OOE62002.1 hypothetical protein BZG18_05650 [Salinivibrio kushneri]
MVIVGRSHNARPDADISQLGRFIKGQNRQDEQLAPVEEVGYECRDNRKTLKVTSPCEHSFSTSSSVETKQREYPYITHTIYDSDIKANRYCAQGL